MNPETATVLFGLSSAVVWGAADFCGGLATRRASVLSVLLVAELSGLAILLGAAWVNGESIPSLPTVGWGIVAGVTGMVGLGALYRGLAVGRAGLVAPMSAVLAAALPAVFTMISTGLPESLTLIGFGLAALAIVLVTRTEGGGDVFRGIQLAMLAGLGFGLFFILIDLAGSESTFYPLVISRSVSVPILLFLIVITKASFVPSRPAAHIALLTGLLDSMGTAFFLLSSQFGRLDVATILSSLYPASTVVLSRLVLGEKTTRMQQAGIAAALIAIWLIAI